MVVVSPRTVEPCGTLREEHSWQGEQQVRKALRPEHAHFIPGIEGSHSDYSGLSKEKAVAEVMLWQRDCEGPGRPYRDLGFYSGRYGF